MSWTKRVQSLRPSLYAAAILALAITVMWGGAQFNTTTTVAASGSNDAPAASFPAASGLGAIPDNSPAGTNVTYNVSGITGSPANISINMDLTHTWVGDLNVTLSAPGGSPSHVIFAGTGKVTATSFGDSSDLAGLYNFTDTAAGTNWWAAAAAVGATVPIPTGDYRTTQAGPQPAANFSPETSINTAFAGVANANGTWTLNISDNAAGDVGTINASTLTMSGGAPTGPPAEQYDFIGGPLADFTILTFPSAGGQVRWRAVQNDNPTSSTSPILDQPWGATATDSIPNVGNYLGTPRSDFTVYRGNTGTPAPNSYLTLENLGGTAVGMQKFQQWGNGATDFIGAEGDYNGDGIIDYTVVRDQTGTFQWYILNSGSNTLTSFPYGAAATDIPLGGADYVGDTRHDPTVIRIAAGSGAITFYIGNNSGGIVKSRNWGTFNTDFVVPGGDYDGDGKADFAVWRGFGSTANGVWYILSATDVATATPFGIPGAAGTRDRALRGGDYDGDGKDDIAVYRDSSTSFIVRRSSDMGTVIQSVSGGAGNANIPLAGFGVQ